MRADPSGHVRRSRPRPRRHDAAQHPRRRCGERHGPKRRHGVGPEVVAGGDDDAGDDGRVGRPGGTQERAPDGPRGAQGRHRREGDVPARHGRQRVHQAVGARAQGVAEHLSGPGERPRRGRRPRRVARCDEGQRDGEEAARPRKGGRAQQEEPGRTPARTGRATPRRRRPRPRARPGARPATTRAPAPSGSPCRVPMPRRPPRSRGRSRASRGPRRAARAGRPAGRRRAPRDVLPPCVTPAGATPRTRPARGSWRAAARRGCRRCRRPAARRSSRPGASRPAARG